ncbi:Protein of unknown function [Neorhodopirellula lusitana]|uniref:DUF3037 domain-containing protein n=1 Tax=Neorhodopirellula lusitana TaxID=445327 RepID=A0ABY1QQG2_9BACT|nr:DUF3037 domain-containing protein [Neorhodopirellula lusitana]SMP75832.1 Protein of unknown function [Neorhodopirellula lusitana]
MNGQFLIARYIPDLERGETENIGILLQSKQKVRTRFIEPEKAQFVAKTDRELFSRWTEYWTDLCNSSRIQIQRDKPVTARSKKFFNSLLKTQEGNFVLERGGLIDDQNASLDEQVDFLFERLVSSRAVVGSTRVALSKKCDDLFREVGLTELRGYQRKYSVRLVYGERETPISFHYGIEQTSPILFHRVHIGDEQSVTSAVGRFDSAVRQNKCSPENCYAIFDSEGPAISGFEGFLSEFANPVNISDQDRARATLSRVVTLAS